MTLPKDGLYPRDIFFDLDKAHGVIQLVYSVLKAQVKKFGFKVAELFVKFRCGKLSYFGSAHILTLPFLLVFADELALNRKFVHRKTHGFPGQFFAYPANFEQNPTGLYNGHPVLRAALT